MSTHERPADGAVAPDRAVDPVAPAQDQAGVAELRAGAGLLSAGAVSALAYALLTLQGPNRLSLVVSIGLGLVILTSTLLFGGPRYAAWTRRGPGGLVVLVVTVSFVATWVALDGGVTSPLNAAFLLPLALSVASAPRSALPITGVFVAGLLVGAAAGGPLAAGPLIIWAAEFALAAVAVAWVANARLRNQRRLHTVMRRLEELASEDPLTGVLNRRGLGTRLQAVGERSLRTAPTALLVIDLDHFKVVNDEHGHAAGDEVLVAAADAIRSTVRSDDVVARTGGEEFAVLLVDTEPETALVVAERLRMAIASCSPKVPVTASIGVALAAIGPPEVDELHRAADRAMYRAKDLGRDRVFVQDLTTSPLDIQHDA